MSNSIAIQVTKTGESCKIDFNKEMADFKSESNDIEERIKKNNPKMSSEELRKETLMSTQDAFQLKLFEKGIYLDY